LRTGKQFPTTAERLRHAGITAKNQPFQMDEVEMQAGDEGSFVGYRFLPLAESSDAHRDAESRPRTQRARLIFKEFAKPQD
jgi:hypothetical protein